MGPKWLLSGWAGLRCVHGPAANSVFRASQAAAQQPTVALHTDFSLTLVVFLVVEVHHPMAIGGGGGGVTLVFFKINTDSITEH